LEKVEIHPSERTFPEEPSLILDHQPLSSEAQVVFDLNQAQAEAVKHTKGPLLVVAGAGSGKTRVIIEKIQHLVETGLQPHSILAITFTNKAAGTMRDRLTATGIKGPWVCTFHSMCVRILKKEAQHLGLSEQFSIFDTDDQTSVIRSVLKEQELDPQEWKPRMLLSEISRLKNANKSSEDASKEADDLRATVISRVYTAYERALETNQAMDFDDLLLKTLQLFREHENVLSGYQRKFKYLLVDEYQDTNDVQYELIRYLAPGTQGLTLTGDPDQSIYSWRGANLNNILNFKNDFNGEGSQVIKMEMNYRSKRHILELANQLIRHNELRYEKDALTDNPDGDKPLLHHIPDSATEAKMIAKIITTKRSEGRKYEDIAVFYRTNHQSRSIEEALIKQGIPYTIVGATRFFERKEVKDLVAYLRFIHNPADSISLMRVVNLPSRGIGESLKSKIREFADDNGLGVWQAMMDPNFISKLPKRSREAVEAFNQLVASFFELAFSRPDLLVEKIVEDTQFRDLFKNRAGEIDEDRMENLEEFMAFAKDYSNKHPGAHLTGFLEEIALIGDKKTEEDQLESDKVTLMTLHASKGLEYPIVLFAGLDEGLLPHSRTLIEGDPLAIEEERRLTYVGITRAEEELYLFTARERMGFKGPAPSKPSRFISEFEGDHLVTNRYGRDLQPRQWTSPFQSAKARSERPLQKGSIVQHERHGKGLVMDLKGEGVEHKARVFFNKQGEKWVSLEYETLTVL
jgi:DNA helicase II / ATP-dependent DNA helicase PcrA